MSLDLRECHLNPSRLLLRAVKQHHSLDKGSSTGIISPQFGYVLDSHTRLHTAPVSPYVVSFLFFFFLYMQTKSLIILPMLPKVAIWKSDGYRDNLLKLRQAAASLSHVAKL